MPYPRYLKPVTCSVMYNFFLSTNVYSNWLVEQFCYLSSDTLYKFSLKHTFQINLVLWTATRLTETCSRLTMVTINTIQGTLTHVQYNTRYCSTCTIQYHLLLHVYNTLQCTLTRVQYNTMPCTSCRIQYKVLLHAYNTT
jgi:hypothetical protein